MRSFLFARFSCSFTDYKSVKPESAAAKDLESIVSNGCYKDGFIPDLQNDSQTKSALNGFNPEEEIKKTEPSPEVANNSAPQGIVLARPCFHLHMFFLVNIYLLESLMLGFRDEQWCLSVVET